MQEEGIKGDVKTAGKVGKGICCWYAKAPLKQSCDGGNMMEEAVGRDNREGWKEEQVEALK